VLEIWSRCALECLGLAGERDEDGIEHMSVLATLDDRGGKASLGDLSVAVEQLTGALSSGCSCPECTSLPWSPDEAEAHDVVQALGELGIAVLRGDAAELTPLGHWLTDFMFRESAPSADADAEVLVSGLAQLPSMVATLMARPWLSSRAPAAAASELLAVAESMSGQERLAAVDLARECGSEAESAWREWAAKDGFGAYAQVWLAEQHDTEPTDADSAWITVDALATMVDTLPGDLPEQLLPP
jgi:hypothetical protein